MFRRLLREYLSLTRGERRGLQVLILIVILLILVRTLMPYIVQYPEPDFSAASEDVVAFLDSCREGLASEKVTAHNFDVPAELFPFDPNTADFEDLIRLGMPYPAARTLINYRKAGGSFANDSDLLRVYGLNRDIYQRLQAFIRINQEVSAQKSDSAPGEWQAFSGKSFPSFELNRADTQQLIEVYGIGPVFARRIVRYRDLLGGFYNHSQLMEVYGFSPTQFEELTLRSFIDTSLLRKMDMNSMDADSLSGHPYLDRYQAGALVSYREQMGSFSDVNQALENHLLPDSVFQRIHPYLSIFH